MYELIYDFTDECGNESFNIVETFEGTWAELEEYIKFKRKSGCYNITATDIDIVVEP